MDFRSGRFKFRSALFCLCTISPILAPGVAHADPLDWLKSNFIDPDDGALDVSNWLEGGGFFPIPLIISEPAVDNGLGLAGIFIHGGDEEAGIEPDISGVAAAYTGNESTIYAGFHQGNYFSGDLK